MISQLPEHTVKAVDRTIRFAFNQGRRILFEHEVYTILAAMGIDVPLHLMVTRHPQVTDELLVPFRSKKIVLKVVAAQVSHKAGAGGVRVVANDSASVRDACLRMERDFAHQGIDIQGILLVQWIEYSRELGNEILLGFRESETFGPVLSFSKGGIDAEHFATHFSPPNLVLAPIDRQWAQALLASTHIYQKYVGQGKDQYVDRCVSAGMAFSNLALAFSNYFESRSDFVLTEFEVNPFIFTPKGRFIALDGLARFEPRQPEPATLALQSEDTIAPFFEPRGIAVVGYSRTDATKPGHIIFQNLLHLHRQDIYAVNPKGGTFESNGCVLPVYPSIKEIGDPVDLAIVTVPAAAALSVVKECAEKGVKAIILIPGGFSEVDRNRGCGRKHTVPRPI